MPPSLLRRARLLALALAPGLAPAAPAQPADGYGVLLVAHGGSAEWNADVLGAVEPLRDRFPIEISFGMADPATVQQAVRRLERQGVRRVGVVRLFVSGESFLGRTRQILGLAPGAPPRPRSTHPGAPHGAGHAGHAMALWRVESDAEFLLSADGLADSPLMGDVIADRARALSQDPREEDVLILAHGPGDDEENQRWLAALDRRAESVRRALPFARVRAATLREDWPEERAAAEAEVRSFVASAAAAGRTPIVIPFRVSGFGGYAAVLDGLAYRADGRGLLPHPAVTLWIEQQAEALRRAGAPDS